jgi:hypothetical protein
MELPHTDGAESYTKYMRKTYDVGLEVRVQMLEHLVVALIRDLREKD